MPTLMNVNEAKANFSSVLANVENNLATIMIVRYGRPIAKIVPIRKNRDVSPMPELVGKVKFTGDWFEDESGDWENA